MTQLNKGAYRAVYDLHRTTLAMLDNTPIDSLWEWYWEQAHAIVEAHNNDEFVIDLVVSVAMEVERRQIELRDAGAISA